MKKTGRIIYAEKRFAENKINKEIDLDSEKVVNIIDMKENEKKVFCRCWLSGTFPLYDGFHQKHNEQSGDNVGPLIVNTKLRTKN